MITQLTQQQQQQVTPPDATIIQQPNAKPEKTELSKHDADAILREKNSMEISTIKEQNEKLLNLITQLTQQQQALPPDATIIQQPQPNAKPEKQITTKKETKPKEQKKPTPELTYKELAEKYRNNLKGLLREFLDKNITYNQLRDASIELEKSYKSEEARKTADMPMVCAT